MKALLTLLAIVVVGRLYAQPNCNVYKMENNEPCYEACIIATSSTGSQGSRVSQEDFDKALALCPTFAYAYFEKAVPYLKRGDFIGWKPLIDQAVNLSPSEYLGYRGWCRYQFVRDFEGAIADFDALEKIVGRSIGYAINGDYHLLVAKALCYKGLGDKAMAIKIIEDHVAASDYSEFPYDYFHLGVLKLEVGEIEEAISHLNKSLQYNPQLAETYYYLGLCFEKQGKIDEANRHLQKALGLYEKGSGRFDPYTTPMDKVFRVDIENALTWLATIK